MAVWVEAAAAVCPAMILIAPGSAVGIPAGSLSNEQADRKINDTQKNFFIVLPLYPTVYNTLHARYHDPGVGNLSQISGSTTDYFLTPFGRRAGLENGASTMAHREEHSVFATLAHCKFGYKSHARQSFNYKLYAHLSNGLFFPLVEDVYCKFIKCWRDFY
jgi:hypothetical protein